MAGGEGRGEGGDLASPHAVSSSPVGRRRRCVLCKLLLKPPPPPHPLSTLLRSRLHPSASHTALRPIRLYVLAPPCEGLCQLCSHLQLSLGAANSKFYQTCRRARFYKRTRRRGRPRLSGEFLEFRATRRDGPRAALPLPFLWCLEFELRKRRSTCAAFLPTYFPSTKKRGIRENVLNMRPPGNKYVHSINMRVPAGVSRSAGV